MGFFTDFVNSLSTPTQTKRAGTGDKDLYKPKFSDLYKNPQTLANEMGESEDRTIVSSGGITRNLFESEKRFAKVGDNYITKPFEQKQKVRADGTVKDDDPVPKKSMVTEVAEEAAETPVTATTTTTPAATTTTPAVQSVLQDAEIGLKGGTIANEADIPSQGISKDDKKGLRPKRSVRKLGMLASYQPGSSQSLLASA